MSVKSCSGSTKLASKLILKKLKFSVKRIKYLRFIISTNGIKADLEKMAVIN